MTNDEGNGWKITVSDRVGNSAHAAVTHNGNVRHTTRDYPYGMRHLAYEAARDWMEQVRAAEHTLRGYVRSPGYAEPAHVIAARATLARLT